MIKGVIFDFDGTILDTESADHQSWLKIYQRYEKEFPFDDYLKCLGTDHQPFNPVDHLRKLTEETIDSEEIFKSQSTLRMQIIQNNPVLPGVNQLIRDAQELNLKKGVASSSERSWVELHLTRLNLINNFDCIYTKDDVLRVKPDPELFIKTLDDLKLEPHEAIVIEDSPNGVLAAKEAGCFTVAVPNKISENLDLSKADLILNSLADLPLSKLLIKANGQFQRIS